ncbi:MAG: hypothetical protein E6Q97_03195 [Desulfurellales bacterium]|nr:MAG: hypothetical protein E6Q97_03195 [Desulfurellales bacterium]
MSRARRFIQRHGSGMKVTAIQAGGGAAVALIDRHLFQSESGKKMFGESTYLKPLLVLGGAHLLKAKAPNLAAGMAGGAGFMLAQTYYASEDEKPADGIVEAGALRGYPPAFAMRNPGNYGYNDAGAVFEWAQN